VVRREGEGGAWEFVVIHRPKYDDWTLPKGKLDPGETEVRAAIREVHEETGMLCAVVREVGSVAYLDRNRRDKTVRYWLMTPVEGRFHPTAEVDELRWLPTDQAIRLLTYDRDRSILRSASSPADADG
jgi:8-oxo-dGTP diphosphatase